MTNLDNRNEAEIMKEVRAAQARYAREWRRKNPDKQRAIVNRYWRKKVAQMQEEENKGTEG